LRFQAFAAQCKMICLRTIWKPQIAAGKQPDQATVINNKRSSCEKLDLRPAR